MAEPPPALSDTALTRERAVRRAVESNVGLLVSRIAPEQAERSARQARRPFVPIVSASASYRDAASLFEDVRVRTLDYDAGVAWTGAAGTSVNLRAGSTEFFSGSSFVPTPTTSIQLAIAQPILRGWMAGQRQLDQQDLDVKRAKAQFEGELNDFIASVDRAYWELAYAQADLEIRERSVERAKAQYEETKANIDKGLLAPGEIFVVEENYVFFQQNLISGQESLELARARLARLLRVDPSSPLRATDGLDGAGALVVSALSASTEEVAESNPRARAAEAELEQAEARLSFEVNQSRPNLDANASVGFRGLANDDEAGPPWVQAVTGSNSDARVGLTFSMPVLGDADAARRERAEADRERVRLGLRQARDDARYGARELTVQLQARRQRLELATRRVELALKKLETEKEKYRSGISTLPNVVLFQRDLDSARIAERRAQADIAALASRLMALRGALPASLGMEVH